ALRTALLERCLVNFPYTRNYRLLTAAELRLVQQPAPPLLIRAAHCQSLSRAQHQRLEAELGQLRRLAHSGISKRAQRPWHKQTIAVCGAGPLPVTGLMLHTLTGAAVSLIERDESAVLVSRALIAQLERLQVLEARAVQVIHADVATFVPCADVVVVASLVDNAAKLQLVEHLRAAGHASGLSALLLRSASSICAELAYEPVDTLMFSDPSLPFCGESVPATDLEHRAERLVSSATEVLNDTELYRPVQLSGAQPSAVSWLRDLLVQLRAAA
ncbi:MAG TPA: nicotianamine synthase family protein, partial [Polyangiales bacterium]|nr:nicotianamine synthase family protein [Polyangiales bacterium]